MQVEVSRPQGHGHGPQPLHPCLKAHPRGPQAVAHGDLHPVQVGDPGHLVAAGKEVGPVVHVFLGVAQDLALAGGAAGGMDAHDLLEGHGPQREGVLVPEVVAGGKGEARQVRKGADAVGSDAGRVQPFPVEGRAFVGVAHRPFEALELARRQGLGVFERGHKGKSGHVGFFQSDISESGRAQAAAGRVVGRGRAQKGPAQVRIHQESVACARGHHPAVGQEIGRPGGGQGPGGVLLHQEDGNPDPGQLVDDVEDFVGHFGGEPQAGFVQEQQARPGHEGPAHGHHLLFAAGEGGGGLADLLPEPGKPFHDPLQAPFPLAAADL